MEATVRALARCCVVQTGDDEAGESSGAEW